MGASESKRSELCFYLLFFTDPNSALLSKLSEKWDFARLPLEGQN